MKNIRFALSLLLCLAVPAGTIMAENTPVSRANYKLPARFSPDKLKTLVFSTGIDAHWMRHSDRFWYVWETPQGKTWNIVDPAARNRRPLFDPVKLAADITRATMDPYDAGHLPIEDLKFRDNDSIITFKVKKSAGVLEAEKNARKLAQGEKTQGEERTGENKKDKEKEKSEKEKAELEAAEYHHFEYQPSTGRLTRLENFVAEPKRPGWAGISPDGETVVFGRGYDLYSMKKADYQKWLNDPEDPTIEEVRLTEDGEEHYAYHRGGGRGETNVDREKNKDKRKPAPVIWSRNSRRFALTRTDNRKVKDLWVINSVAKTRPTLETYRYQMPGEEGAPQIDVLIFDLDTGDMVKVEDDAFPDQTVRIQTAPRLEKERDLDYRAPQWLSSSPDKLFFTRTSRDLHRIDLCVADAATGKVKTLIEERLNTYLEERAPGLIDDGREIVWWSERDGWAHFYLYDGEGGLKTQITSGPWHADRIQGIDPKSRTLTFTANGREPGEDPYYMHLYRVNLDGSGLKLLNPGNFDHHVSMNDNRTAFIDTFSRVDCAPRAELRDGLGKKILDLEEADLSRLFETGYKMPEAFKAKAADGITDIYGVMYKPLDFDEAGSYPIIAYVYPGPQTEAVDKAFSVRMDRTGRLAQFGFIVVTLGNRGGHPARSKWYHNYGYGNLRDYGLADKKAVIEQLAASHPFIDIDRVGIFGHSGGGFMSTAALLVYPDFFKVAVSSSGNHENNIYNRWWSEKHHGVREVEQQDGSVRFEYDIEKNSDIAGNLKGRLLICTGDIDNNVHPGNTIRLANALIKAHKRFDFFLFPGQRHGYGDMNEYFFWLRGDYFCRHLIGDYNQSVDIISMTREEEKNGRK